MTITHFLIISPANALINKKIFPTIVIHNAPEEITSPKIS